jgi:uncharacterized protein (DUF885 family)
VSDCRPVLRSFLAALVLALALSPVAHGAEAIDLGDAPRVYPAYVPARNEPAKTAADRRFDQVIDAWFALEARERPTFATNTGVHDYDTRLEATSREAILARRDRARRFLQAARGLEPGHLSPWRRLDQASFVARMNAIELDLETTRGWERNPNYYPGLLSGAIFSLVKRDYAPADVRLRAVNARLAEARRVFADARANLKSPPRIQTEVAIGQTRGLVTFLRDIVPARLAAASDAAAKATFVERQKEAIAETEAYVAWLEKDLLPRSDGDFRIGRDAYQKKLLYDEGFGEDVDSVLARGYRELAANHRRMVETARLVDPAKSPPQVLADMAASHPGEHELLDATRAGLDKIRAFIADKKICTPPANQNLIVAETPIFNRSASFASMDSPGVFEKNANEAYYNVTPVDSAWSAEKKAEHLGFYNPWQLEIVSIHEAFPGHYYQFLHLKQSPSLVRQLMGTGSNSEGWAHYCEEMALEQGYGGGEPRYTMAMLNLALQRIGRYIAGIEMHVNGWTMEQATAFFEKECYMARVNAEREARRGTSDPTYLVYSLGKWEFQRLRADVQAAQGSRFVLGDFHDRILEIGRLPLPLMRTAFMDDDSYGLLTRAQ